MCSIDLITHCTLVRDRESGARMPMVESSIQHSFLTVQPSSVILKLPSVYSFAQQQYICSCVNLCVCMCWWGHMCTYARGEQRSMSVLPHSHSTLFLQSLLLSLKLTNVARQGCLVNSRHLLVSTPNLQLENYTCIPMLDFNMGAGNSNSDP